MEHLWVDGMSIWALESRTIKDRIQIGEEGVLIVNTRDGNIESRGLFFPDEITASHTAISQYVKKHLTEKKADENAKNFQEFLTKDLSKMVLKVWEREPVVVCI